MTVILKAVEGNADLAFALQIIAMSSTDAILQWEKAQWCEHIVACLMQALGVGEENLSKLCRDLQNCYDKIQQGRFQGKQEALHDTHARMFATGTKCPKANGARASPTEAYSGDAPCSAGCSSLHRTDMRHCQSARCSPACKRD